MSKRILIDSSDKDEIRVAVTTNGKLDDFEIETSKKTALKGDVYLAKITRVEPSLQAAFVDFGVNRNGFLPLTEIHPDYFKIPIADQEKLKELSSKLQFDEEVEDNNLEITDDNNNKFNKDSSEDDTIEENNKTRKRIDHKKNYLNFFRKYKIQGFIAK